jgi:hypothetical protein
VPTTQKQENAEEFSWNVICRLNLLDRLNGPIFCNLNLHYIPELFGIWASEDDMRHCFFWSPTNLTDCVVYYPFVSVSFYTGLYSVTATDEDMTPSDTTIDYKASSFLQLYSDFWYNSLGSTCICHYLLVGTNVSQSISPSKLNFQFISGPTILY